MAIIKITSPLATAPNVFASPVINQLLALAVDCNHGYRIGGGVVKKGSLWNIGGVMFIADADTTILGSKNQGLSTCAMAIKFTVSGDTATASYVNDLTGVTWNGEYQGYYDASGNMYYYKCKKDTRVTGQKTGLLLHNAPKAGTAVGADTWLTTMDGYRVSIEHTGSYNFDFSRKLNATTIIASVNGVPVYTFNTTGYDFYVPFFLEEGDIFSLRATSIDSGIVWLGLVNDTFGVSWLS